MYVITTVYVANYSLQDNDAYARRAEMAIKSISPDILPQVLECPV